MFYLNKSPVDTILQDHHHRIECFPLFAPPKMTVIGLKKYKQARAFFSFYSRTTMGAASPFLFQLWNSNVEIDLAMQD